MKDIRLPYDILLLCFEHVAQIPLLSSILADSGHVHLSFPSPLGLYDPGAAYQRRNDLLSCSLVCRDWSQPAFDIMDFYLSEGQKRGHLVKDPLKVQICTWLKSMSTDKLEFGKRVSSFMRRLLPSHSPRSLIDFQPQLSLDISTLRNLRCLMLNGRVMMEIQQITAVSPLVGLKQLSSFVISNLDPRGWDAGFNPPPSTGKSLNMQDVIYWIKDTAIQSLELYDVRSIYQV